MERLMLKPLEAAEAIGMGRTAFYRLVKAGQIPACRVGKSIRIPVNALREWVEKQVGSNGAGPVQPARACPELKVAGGVRKIRA